MVSRTWRAWTAPGLADGFTEHLRRTGIAEAQALAGYRGHVLGRTDEGDRVRFTLLTLWEDVAAIHAFAGEDIGVARAYPDDDRWIAHADATVAVSTVIAIDVASWLKDDPTP